MAFRANEEAEDGFKQAERYLCNPRHFSPEELKSGREWFSEAVEWWGPVVNSYPNWHPIMAEGRDNRSPILLPDDRCGYSEIDHLVTLKNAFITCPYSGGEEILKAVNNFEPLRGHAARLCAEKIDVPLYYEGTTPILVTCEWNFPLEEDGTISSRCALALMLEEELAGWPGAQVGETWETMQPCILGNPHGSRSSLFVNEKTGQLMKKAWALLNEGRVFGPVFDRTV